ncbi:uncharacterized [Tachysurus ichikawai]
MHTLLYSLPNCNFFSCGKKKKEHVGKGKVTDMHDSCQVERECSECFSYRETCQAAEMSFKVSTWPLQPGFRGAPLSPARQLLLGPPAYSSSSSRPIHYSFQDSAAPYGTGPLLGPGFLPFLFFTPNFGIHMSAPGYAALEPTEPENKAREVGVAKRYHKNQPVAG